MNGEVRQELRKLYNRWYKGDPLVMTSHSTLVSHTKTYTRCQNQVEVMDQALAHARPLLPQHLLSPRPMGPGNSQKI